MANGEAGRLEEDDRRLKNWKRWGPYLSERQWATVREDYSPDGNLWESFPYEHSLARAYRWGEDGLLGLTDRECRLCFAPALWNGSDPHLKLRALIGLIPLLAVQVLNEEDIRPSLPDFHKRTEWF